MIFHSGFQKHVALWEPTSAVRLYRRRYYIRSYCSGPLEIVAPINIVLGFAEGRKKGVRGDGGGKLHLNPLQFFSDLFVST